MLEVRDEEAVTLDEIAKLVGGRLFGDGAAVVTGVSGIEEAREGDLTFLSNQRYLPFLDKTKAAAVLVQEGTRCDGVATIEVENPNYAFAQVSHRFLQNRRIPPVGIHPSAVVAPGARIGRNASIGACAVVEEGAVVGDESILYPLAYVGFDAKVGARCVLYPHSAVMDGCELGSGVILHCGAVVGSDGFGYVTVGGVHHKIPQLGTAVLEDDVEVGANTTVDRARFDRTVVGKGTKIDNLVQIAHNVEIGENCLLVAQSGVSGSTTLGKNVTLGAHVGITGHLTLADGTMIAAGANRIKDTKPGTVYSGYYAVEHAEGLRQLAAFQKLPQMMEEIRRLRKEVEKLAKPE